MALDLGVFLAGGVNVYKVKVSSNDSEPNYLINKIISSDGSVTIAETNDGGVEQIDLTNVGFTSPLTTKGDILVYSSLDTRLGVGADGEVLTADSTQAEGVKWATVASSSIYTGDDTLTENRTLTYGGFSLTFDGGQLTNKGAGATSATTNLLLENSVGTDLFYMKDDGEFAIGNSASVFDDTDVAIGTSATSPNTLGVAIGKDSEAQQRAVAIGATATSSALQTVSVGYGATSPDQHTTAIGYNSVGSGVRSTLLGTSTTANYQGIAVGYNASAVGSGLGTNIALGYQADANNQYSIAIGYKATASANNAYIIASSATARTNSTANSMEVNFDEATSTFRIGQSVDSWYNGTGSFGFGTATPSANSAVEITTTSKASLKLTPMTAAQASAVTAENGQLLYVSTTDATFTSVGIWAYENGAWVKL